MISITIPTHNRAHLISRAIRSVINQTFINWELWIIDDGSTDNTEEVVDQFTKNDERIHYLKKENEGATIARNKGVELSCGEFITFLDSDDEAKPTWLAEYAEMINNRNAQVMCCGLEIFDENQNLLNSKLPSEQKLLFPGVVAQFTNGGSYLLKKEIFLKIGGFDNHLKSGQHTEMGMRLIPYLQEQSIPIVTIKKPLINIHIHAGERIRTDFRSKYEGTKYNLKKHNKFYSSRPAAKATLEGVLAFNALKIGKRKDAFKYSVKSFKSNPSLKRLARIIYYTFG